METLFFNGEELRRTTSERKHHRIEALECKSAFNLWQDNPPKKLRSKALTDVDIADIIRVVPGEESTSMLKKRQAIRSTTTHNGSWATKRSRAMSTESARAEGSTSRLETEEIDFHFAIMLSITEGNIRVVPVPEQSPPES